MASFLIAVAFAPLLLVSMWMYMSPLPGLSGRTTAKALVRTGLAVVVLGGLFAQLGLLARDVPLDTRRFWMMTLLMIEGIPLLSILFYRDSKNRKDNRDKP